MTGKRGKNTVDILVAGVGGQGVLLASEVIAEAAALSGLEVKKSEVHGMAQRGGSVVSHLRFGNAVHSPLVTKGEADFLVSFEKLETLRYLDYLHSQSWVLVNSQQILPLPVSTGRAEYPRRFEALLREAELNYKLVDAPALAARAGNPKAVNSVMVGTLSLLLPFEEDQWVEVLRRLVPERYREVNYKAFEIGRSRRIRRT